MFQPAFFRSLLALDGLMDWGIRTKVNVTPHRGDPKKRLELVGRRQDVAFAMSEYQYLERLACELISIDLSTYRYQPQSDHNAERRDRLIALARQKQLYGHRRLTGTRRSEGATCIPAV